MSIGQVRPHFVSEVNAGRLRSLLTVWIFFFLPKGNTCSPPESGKIYLSESEGSSSPDQRSGGLDLEIYLKA